MVPQTPLESTNETNKSLATDEELWNQVEKVFKVHDIDGDGKLNKEET